MDQEETIRNRMQDVAVGGFLPCDQAFALSDELSATPMDIGDIATASDVRVSLCQLGLFGYGPKSEGRHRIVEPAEHVSSILRESIESRVQSGRLPCGSAWDIARQLSLSKLEVSAAAEAMGIRISACQLGCF